MWNCVSQLLHGRWRAFALSLFVVTAPLQGCMVNNSSSRGNIIVQWAPQGGTSCGSLGIASINVVASRDGSAYGTFTNGICTSGAMTIQVGEGTYVLHVEGVGYDGSIVASTPSVSVPVMAYSTVSSAVLVLSPLGTSTGNNSSIQATWTVNGQAPAIACGANNLKSVVLSIVDSTQTQVIATAQSPCANGVATALNLAAGTYYLQLDGYTPSDATGQPSWGTTGLKGPFVLNANTDMTFNSPIDIVKLGTTSALGGLTLGWTVFGKSAITGCSQYVIDKLNVTVLGADKTQQLQTTQVACSAGQISFANLPVGAVYVRIDEANPPDTSAYGNINFAGPVSILANQTATIATPIDIGQRSIVTVPLAFDGGGSCSTHGVGSVKYQILGDSKLIVPFTDADATKPCELSSTTFAQHVIDLDNSPPACAVPDTATGLVVCNAHGIATLTVQAQAISSTGIGYAAKMDVTGLVDGKLTAVKVPLDLQVCASGDPLCPL